MDEEKTGPIYIDEATTIDRETFKQLIESDFNMLGWVATKVSSGYVERLPPERFDFKQFVGLVVEAGLARVPFPQPFIVTRLKETPKQRRKAEARKKAKEMLLAAGRHDSMLLECDLDFIVEPSLFVDHYEEIGLPTYHAFGDRYGALIWEEIDLRKFCVLQKATWRDTMRLEYRR